MTEFISRLLRTIVLAVLAMVGMGMALIFMLSTAIAVGVLYVVARLRGRPFGVRAYWQQRQAQAEPRQPAGFGQPAAAGGFRPRRAEVIDVESRDVS